MMQYADKENTGLGSDHSLGSAPHLGKPFQVCSQLNPTPRKVLENITTNVNDISFIKPGVTSGNLGGIMVKPDKLQEKKVDKSKISAFDCLAPPIPASRSQRLSKERYKKPQTQDPVIETLESGLMAESYPEIEHIPSFEEPEDNFADVWDPIERPDTYIKEMLKWRPTRIFPFRDEYIHGADDLLEDEADDTFSVHNFSIHELEAEWESDLGCLHIPLPPLDYHIHH